MSCEFEKQMAQYGGEVAFRLGREFEAAISAIGSLGDRKSVEVIVHLALRDAVLGAASAMQGIFLSVVTNEQTGFCLVTARRPGKGNGKG